MEIVERSYLSQLRQLHSRKINNRIAPHKAILLISIFEMIGDGLITKPFIEPSEILEQRFKTVWVRYVPNDDYYKPLIAKPFYHMSGEQFWHLVCKGEYDVHRKQTPSWFSIQKYYEGANIDTEFFDLLKTREFRVKATLLLIKKYLMQDITQ